MPGALPPLQHKNLRSCGGLIKHNNTVTARYIKVHCLGERVSVYILGNFYEDKFTAIHTHTHTHSHTTHTPRVSSCGIRVKYANH